MTAAAGRAVARGRRFVCAIDFFIPTSVTQQDGPRRDETRRQATSGDEMRWARDEKIASEVSREQVARFESILYAR